MDIERHSTTRRKVLHVICQQLDRPIIHFPVKNAEHFTRDYRPVSYLQFSQYFIQLARFHFCVPINADCRPYRWIYAYPTVSHSTHLMPTFPYPLEDQTEYPLEAPTENLTEGPEIKETGNLI